MDSCSFDVVQLKLPYAGRKCSPTGRLFHLQELRGTGGGREAGREGGFQCNIYSDLFLSLARGPWELTGEDKQWTIGFRDEQQCQHSMCHYGMWVAESHGGHGEDQGAPQNYTWAPAHEAGAAAALKNIRCDHKPLYFTLLAVSLAQLWCFEKNIDLCCRLKGTNPDQDNIKMREYRGLDKNKALLYI